MNLLAVSKQFLNGMGIQVPDDWLQACVEWIVEENQGRVLNGEQISSQVYEQWLLSDLHELETSCLPEECKSATKYELKGVYALQVDSIVDVGVSYYSQSQKLQGTENANVLVTADDATQKPWEQKPSRMLMLRLTDGSVSVQGMEYRPISCLSPQTRPGAKILVEGSVLCRHGILMLKAENVRLLGGEVDTLVEANTLLNSLQSAMDASNENAGKEHSQTFAGSEVRKNNTDRAGDRGTQQKPVAGPSGRGATPASANQSSFKKGNAGTRANEYNQKDNRKLQTHTSVQPAGKQPGGQVQDISQQDYDALMSDMDDFMDEIDDQVPMVKPVNTTDRFHGNTHQRSNAGSVQTSSTAVPRQKQQQCSQQSSKQTFQKESCVLQSRSDLMVSNSNKPTSSDLGNYGDDLEVMDFEDDFSPMNDDFEKMYGNTYEKENKCSVRESTNPDHGSAIRNVKDVATSNGTIAKIVQSSLTSFVHRSTDQNKSEPSSHKHLNITEENVHTKNIKDENIASVARVSETVTDKVKTLKVENLPVIKSAGSDSVLIGQSHGQVARIIQLKRQQAELVNCGNTDDLECEYPFTYLCKVMSQPLTQQPVYHTVKAYISTLTSKLNNVDNKWTLSCKINDGTRAVDVDLSSQLLTEMIGFSPAEANTMKARIRTEPGLKQVLKDGIQQCQQKLTELMCLLELETSTSLPRPKVVATKQVTSHHTNMLYNRVLANWKD